MFEGWGEFYLFTGSAAAVLIGLIFVVVTLFLPRGVVGLVPKLRLALAAVLRRRAGQPL